MINFKTSEWSIEDVECVLFDKDGTFIDLHYFWGKMTELRALEIINEYNLNHDKFEKLCLMLGYDKKTKKMLPDGITALYSRVKIIEIFNKELNEIGINTTEKSLEIIFDKVNREFYKEITDFIFPVESAIDFIKEIRKFGVKIGIVTSDSVVSTNYALEKFGLKDFFDIVIGRESSKYTKESGMPTQLALERLNANPAKTIMIGDAPMDYISAKNAGIINAILVATGQIDKLKLLETSRYVVNSLKEISIY